MSLDIERIEDRAAYIEEQKAALERLIAAEARDAILLDPWKIKGIKYTLQTMVEALIDIAFHVCAKGLHYAPRDTRDAIAKLAEHGILNPSDKNKYSAMIGFRNRVVHGYLDVEDARVYEIAAFELGDFDGFIRAVLEYGNRVS